MSTKAFENVLDGPLALPAPGSEKKEKAPRVEAEVDIDEGGQTSRPEKPAPLSGTWEVIEELLRDRMGLIRRIESEEGLTTLARAMLPTVVVCMAIFGGAVGFYRGGLQIPFAMIKLPAVALLTTCMVAPIYTALKRVLGQPYSIVRDFALILASLTLFSLVLAALTPFVIIGILGELGYHKLILLVVGVGGVSGFAAYELFFRGMNREISGGHRVIASTLLVVLGLVGTQLSWTLRPYLVRPQTEETPFMREIEGSFFDAVRTTFDSARGIYSYKRSSGYGSYEKYERAQRGVDGDVTFGETNRRGR